MQLKGEEEIKLVSEIVRDIKYHVFTYPTGKKSLNMPSVQDLKDLAAKYVAATHYYDETGYNLPPIINMSQEEFLEVAKLIAEDFQRKTKLEEEIESLNHCGLIRMITRELAKNPPR